MEPLFETTSWGRARAIGRHSGLRVERVVVAPDVTQLLVSRAILRSSSLHRRENSRLEMVCVLI